MNTIIINSCSGVIDANKNIYTTLKEFEEKMSNGIPFGTLKIKKDGEQISELSNGKLVRINNYYLEQTFKTGDSIKPISFEYAIEEYTSNKAYNSAQEKLLGKAALEKCNFLVSFPLKIVENKITQEKIETGIMIRIIKKM